jgi:uncharacterized delta-60 repeat protein
MQNKFTLLRFVLSLATVSTFSACGTYTFFDGVGSIPSGQNESLQCVTPPMHMGSGFNGTVNMIQIDPSNCNRIYVSGDFSQYNGVNLLSQHLARINADGSLDQTFQVGVGPDAHLSGIALMPDGSGRVYLGGSFQNFAGQPLSSLVRILPSGAVDPSFNTGASFDNGVFRVLALNDGTNRVYAVGFFTQFNNTVANGIVRLNSDGSADPNFISGAGFDGLVQNIAIDPKDSTRLYGAGGFRNYNNNPAPSLIRLNADGTQDNSFAIGMGFDCELFGVTASIDGSNQIYVTSGANPATGLPPQFQGVSVPIGVSRINSDGTLDQNFNIGAGFSPPNTLYGGVVYNVAIATDGSNKIYAAGQFSQVNGVVANNVVRLNPDGSVDNSFVTVSGFDSRSFFPMLAADGTNDLFYFGTFSAYRGATTGGMIRMNQFGTIDSL